MGIVGQVSWIFPLETLSLKNMVKIIGAHARMSEKGQFMSLELLGMLEQVKIQQTGKMYATARKCFIGKTYDAETDFSFVGQTLPGTLSRVPYVAFSYTIPGTKQELTLSHTWAYLPPEHEFAAKSSDEYFKSEMELIK